MLLFKYSFKMALKFSVLALGGFALFFLLKGNLLISHHHQDSYLFFSGRYGEYSKKL